MRMTTENASKRSRSLKSLARHAIVLLLAATSFAAQAAIVAHWKFDESSGTIAHDSAGSLHGALSASGAAFVSGGIAGNALSLNRAGGGFVNMGNVLGFTNQPFSIVAWIKTATGYSVNDSAVVSKHAAFTANGYWFMANQAGGGGQVGKAIFGEGTTARSATTTTTVNDGNWHQIVATWRPGGVMLVYVDGAPPEAANNASPALAANSVAFLIGAVNVSGVPQARYTGLVDDVQVYDSALSDGEIAFLFEHPGEVAQACSQQLANVRAQLATCQTALAVANQDIQNLQNEIRDLLLPLQGLTLEFRATFNDPQFQIRGETSVEQMQNLVLEILDLPRGQQQGLFLKLGGDRSNRATEARPGASAE